MPDMQAPKHPLAIFLIRISGHPDIPFPGYSKNFENVIALMIDRLTLPFARIRGRMQIPP
jgi:hypothetical protein